jgi:putative DNA primase/helicase
VTRFKPCRSKVVDVRTAIAACCLIDDLIEPPAWLINQPDLPPPGELFACSNGLLHVSTRTIHPATPNFFGVAASTVTYDESAAPPHQWLKFLDQALDDQEAIATLQEWFGYLLTADTSQQKLLFCLGQRRSGKGTIARVLTALLGKQSVGGPTMSSLGEQFGLESLITKPLAIVPDARMGGRTDKMVIVERLLTISGEDALSVPRKFLPDWIGKLPTRIIIITNELPSLTEGSGALLGRFIVLLFPNSFFGHEDIGLTNKLLTELPGILNWAIEGYCRLRERGYFIQPKNALDLIDQIEALGSPVKAFVRQRCEIGSGFEVSIDDLFEHYKEWCQEENRRDPGNKEWFGRNLRAAVQGLGIIRKGGQKEAYYIGLRPLYGLRRKNDGPL